MNTYREYPERMIVGRPGHAASDLNLLGQFFGSLI